MSKRYVVGFMFDVKKNVLLVKKEHPVIWKGLHTGPGGKIEPGESGPAAMVREFMEETHIETKEGDWGHVATVRTGAYEVEFYRAFGDPRRFWQVEDEELRVHSAYRPPEPMFDNARWALAIALDPCIKGPVVINYHAYYVQNEAPAPAPVVEMKLRGRHGESTLCHAAPVVAD